MSVGDYMKFKYFIPSMIMMILIFVFSSQTGNQSSELSNGILLWLQQTLHITIPTLIIRKCAHISEFAILMLTFVYAYKNNNINHYIVYAFISTVFYACTDEFHQLFVENRSGNIIDVCIDSIGPIIIIIICKIKNSLPLFLK